jgi:hypothetical protein
MTDLSQQQRRPVAGSVLSALVAALPLSLLAIHWPCWHAVAGGNRRAVTRSFSPLVWGMPFTVTLRDDARMAFTRGRSAGSC